MECDDDDIIKLYKFWQKKHLLIDRIYLQMLKQFCKIFVFQLNSQRVDSQSDDFNFKVDKDL